MRAGAAYVTLAPLLAGAVALAADRLGPNDIQTTFFTGEPFTASTPQKIQYKMVFTPDGKMTREPIGRSGAKGEGTWKLTKEGYCTTWKGNKQGCFVVLSSGDNKWSVMKGTTAVAIWSK